MLGDGEVRLTEPALGEVRGCVEVGSRVLAERELAHERAVLGVGAGRARAERRHPRPHRRGLRQRLGEIDDPQAAAGDHSRVPLTSATAPATPCECDIERSATVRPRCSRRTAGAPPPRPARRPAG